MILDHNITIKKGTEFKLIEGPIFQRVQGHGGRWSRELPLGQYVTQINVTPSQQIIVVLPESLVVREPEEDA